METEVALVHAARGGDHQAFAALVERYQRPVFSLAYRMLGNVEDAEDAGQEVFLRAFRALGGFDFRRPFSTWLLSIAAHHCIDRLRRRRPVESLDALPPWREPVAEAVDLQHAAESRDEADRIQVGLARLPDEYRLVLILRYWYDLGYADIAGIVGGTESAIKSRLHRARRQMAAFLIPDGALDAGRDATGRPDGTTPTARPGGQRPWNAIARAS